MGVINLICDGIEIPAQASLTIQQEYTPAEGGSSELRMSDGGLIKQTAWSGKTNINTTGTGRTPLPLNSIDFALEFVMQCVNALTKHSLSNAIAITGGYRTDVDFIGYAVVNGKQIKTPVISVTEILNPLLIVIGHTVTVRPVIAASSYHVIYFPSYTVFANPPIESGGTRGSSRSWALSAKEK